jgi:hypothetical protein
MAVNKKSTIEVNNIAELDFIQLRESLRDYLKGQTVFQDYNFEGSALTALLNILAYNTHYFAYHLNMLSNEMFLDTATQRGTTISIAKALGYTPASRTASKAYLTIRIRRDSGSASTYTLPKYTIITATDGVTSYDFVTTSSQVATFDGDNIATFNNIQVKEGARRQIIWKVDGNDPDQKFIIPDPNVDTGTLTVVVQNSRVNSGQEAFTQFDNLSSVRATSPVYYVQEVENSKFEIYFGDGVFGKPVSNGNLIIVDYISTNGEVANGIKSFSTTLADSTVTVLSTTLYDSTSQSFGGSARETIKSIKYRAPREFEGQQRTMNANDYETRILNDFPNVGAVNVTGGELLSPPKFGTVQLTIKPKKGDYLSTSEKDEIESHLRDYQVGPIRANVVDPVFLDVLISSNVSYSLTNTALDESEMEQLVKNAIVAFVDENVNQFSKNLVYSQLVAAIDDASGAITGNETNLVMKLGIVVSDGTARNFSLDFGNPLGYPSDASYGYIRSDVFTYDGDSTCYLRDYKKSDGSKVLGIFSKDQGAIVKEIGIVDYAKGTIDIRNLSADFSGKTQLDVLATAQTENVLAGAGKIIRVKESDLNIEARST